MMERFTQFREAMEDIADKINKAIAKYKEQDKYEKECTDIKMLLAKEKEKTDYEKLLNKLKKKYNGGTND